MKLLKSLKDLKIGQKVAWLFVNRDNIFLNDYDWICITQVKGLHKKTIYPKHKVGIVYESKEMINFDVLAMVNDNYSVAKNFLLDINTNKNEMESGYNYDEKFWEVWLIEDDKDYNEVLKHLLVNSL